MLQTPTPRLPGWEWRPVRYRTRVKVFEHLTRWQVIHAGVSRKTNQDHKCMRPTQSKSRSIKIEIFSKGSEETGPFVFSVSKSPRAVANARLRSIKEEQKFACPVANEERKSLPFGLERFKRYCGES